MVVAVADEATAAAVAAVDDPRVGSVPNPAGTTSAGLNLAVAATAGEIIVRCDAHSTLPPGYVATALAALEGTGAVNVGGRQVPTGRTLQERAIALAMQSPIGAGDARYRIGGDPGPVDTVYLGVFRRDALEAVGGFDETMVRNQDYELNWRLRQAGGLVWFDPNLVVGYRPRGSLVDLWKQYFQYGWWKRVMLRRHPGSLRWRQLAPPLLVAGLIVSGLSALVHPAFALALPATYGMVTVGAAVADGIRHREPAAALEPLALWVMHIAWGSGFISSLPRGRH